MPLEPAVRAGGDDGVPVMLSDPQSPAAVEITAIARRIVRSGSADPVQRMSRRLNVV